MVVVFSLMYLFGSLLVFFGVRSLARTALNASAMEDLWALGLGVGIVLAAAAVQTFATRQRDHSGSPEVSPAFPLRLLTLTYLAWVVPLLIAWVKFELHTNPIYIFPWLTVGGAMATVAVASRWVTHTNPYSRVISAVLVALIGLPLGAFSVEAISSHFHYHLTDVRILTYDHETESVDTHDFEAPDPVFYADDPAVGNQVGEFFEALTDAKPIDLGEEIEQGRAKIDTDGETILWLQDGEWVAIEQLNQTDLDAILDQASAADAAEHAKREAIRRAAFEKELELRRRGGRLFSRPK